MIKHHFSEFLKLLNWSLKRKPRITEYEGHTELYRNFARAHRKRTEHGFVRRGPADEDYKDRCGFQVGSFFKLTPGVETVLYSFGVSPSVGVNPLGLVAAPGGNWVS